MWPNLQFYADLVTFTEAKLNGKLFVPWNNFDPEFRIATLHDMFYSSYFVKHAER